MSPTKKKKHDAPVTLYDGCGRCWVGVRRLSRETDKTSSPERQAEQVLEAAKREGGHVIGWGDDWEVSGAVDPLVREGLGPWLLGKMGPYDGIVSSTVDRVGREVVDTINCQRLLTKQGRAIVTHDHIGVWDFSDPNQENEWMIKAWGSQIELRAIQKRNKEDAVRARNAGEIKQRPAYGFKFERPNPKAKVSKVVLDDVAAEILKNVKDRILAAFNAQVNGKIEITVSTEAARLNREKVPSPRDRLRQLYGKDMEGDAWSSGALRTMLRSEAALGYLMHKGRPVVGDDGMPVQIAEEALWDRATHEALIKATDIRGKSGRAQKGEQLLTGIAFCGQCGWRLYVAAQPQRDRTIYRCLARGRGIAASQHCKPAPTISSAILDARVSERFLADYGDALEVERVWDPGTGHQSEIASLEAARTRLRDDRSAGLYDSIEDRDWYQRTYKGMTEQIEALANLPKRDPGFREKPTGRTVRDKWSAADAVGRREMLMEFGARAEVRPGRRNDERVTVTFDPEGGGDGERVLRVWPSDSQRR